MKKGPRPERRLKTRPERRSKRLFPALSVNGVKVHLADKAGRPACGSGVFATCRVRARITCPACAKRPQARRHARKPHVVGLDWSPMYAAWGRALEDGATREPSIRHPYWPKLAPAEAQ